MPFPVACGCGQKFMAQDHLTGKEVPCPACGNPLLIQPPEAAPTPPAAPARKPVAKSTVKPPAFQGAPASKPATPTASLAPIPVRCACGKAYKAPGVMRGKSLKCPACGQDVPIPLNPPPAAPVQATPTQAAPLDLGGDLFAADPFGAPPLGADPLGADLFNLPLAGGPPGGAMGMPAASGFAAPMPAPQPMNPYGTPQVSDDGGGNNKLLIFLGGGVALVLIGLFVGIFLINRNKQPVATSSPPTTPSTTPASTPATTPTTPTAAAPAATGGNPMGPMGGVAASPMGDMGPMGGMNPMGPMGGAADPMGGMNPMGGMGPMGVAADPTGANTGANPMGPMGAAPMPGFDPASNGGIVGTAPATAAGAGAGGTAVGPMPMGPMGAAGADPTGGMGPMPMGAGVPAGPMGPMGVNPMGPMGAGPMGAAPAGPMGAGFPGRAGVPSSSPQQPGRTRPGRGGNSEGPDAADDAAALAAARPAGKALGLALNTWHPSGKLVGIRRVGDGDNVQAHYSWMTQILPFIGQQKLYDKFDFNKPQYDAANLQNGAYIVPEFLNPADDRLRWKGYPYQNYALTHFVGMSGIEDSRNVVAGKLPRSDPRAGIFGYDGIATPAEITDGTSNTIMALGGGELANPWVMGGGATIRGAREPYFDKISGFGSKGTNGVLVVMADGSVRTISSNISPAVFRALCTIHGAEKIDLATDAPLSTDK